MDFSSFPAHPMATYERNIPEGKTLPPQSQIDPSLAELGATPPGVYFEDSDPFDMHCYPETEWSKTALFCTSTALNVPPGKKPLANTSSRASNAQLDPWADPTSQYPCYVEDSCDTSVAGLANNTTSNLCRYNPSPSSPAPTALASKPPEHSRWCSTLVRAPSIQNPDFKFTQRKRGRQSRYHSSSGTYANPITNSASQSKCIPHTEVERKYREKLNAEIERLRRAVPVLPQSSTADVMNLSKPSKGMVLAVAFEYIKELESQGDAAVREIERLGGKIRFEERRECSRGHRTEV